MSIPEDSAQFFSTVGVTQPLCDVSDVKSQTRKDLPMSPFHARVLLEWYDNALTQFALLDLGAFLLTVSG